MFAELFSNYGREIVLWDEVDLLSTKAQRSLKGLMDRLNERVDFIFTTNHYEKLETPFVDRCNAYDFSVHNKALLLTYAKNILKLEGKTLDTELLAYLVHSSKPSIRKLVRNLEVA